MERRNVLRNNVASLWANAPVVMLSGSRPSSLLSRTAKWMNYFICSRFCAYLIMWICLELGILQWLHGTIWQSTYIDYIRKRVGQFRRASLG